MNAPTKWKQTGLLLSSAALAITAAGCTGGGGTKVGTGTDDKAANDTTPITYSMFRNAAYIVGYPDDGGPMKKLILEQAAKGGVPNVDYKVTISGGSEYLTKLNVLSASNQLPDYFSVDVPTMIKYADEGLILPLDDLLDKYAPALTKLQDKNEMNMLRYKGKIWAVAPGYRPESFNAPSVAAYNIRTDWLANLGLKMPTTLDELYTVLKAFTLNDPDKDGKKNTYGLSAPKVDNSGRPETFNMVFGAYGIQPSFFIERNGKIQKGFTLPETKEALKLLQAWYKEGLIDPDFMTNEAKHLDEKVTTSKVGVWFGSALDVNPTTPRFSSLVKLTPTGKIGTLPAPAGPKGLKGYPESAPGYGDLRAISAKAKQPERLMKLINWSADDSANGGFWMATYGKEGEHYTFDKDKNLITQTVALPDLYKAGAGNPTRFVQVVDRRWVPSEEARQSIGMVNKDLSRNSFWMTTPAMFDYPDLENKLWPEYFYKIVLGELPIDAWDEFVKKYYDQGGKKIEDEANAAWKAAKSAK